MERRLAVSALSGSVEGAMRHSFVLGCHVKQLILYLRSDEMRVPLGHV